jgi:nucleotide-binding universal stress UspA family protein
MNKRILLGVDADLSPTTQYALRAVGEFVAQAAAPVHLTLLNVISITQVVAAHPALYVGQVMPLIAPSVQRERAEEVLHRARLILQRQGIDRELIDEVVRIGSPADEIVKVAKELQVSFIVVGSRGESVRQKLRRFFAGSVSHRVLQLASCPVMIATPPRSAHPRDLVVWYEDAIKRYLNENTSSLAVFTPEQVAQQFVPPHKNTAGRKEIAAARLALEQLAVSGLLCRHQVEGELRYVND